MVAIPSLLRSEIEDAIDGILDGALPSQLESSRIDFKEEVGSRSGEGDRIPVPEKNELAAQDLAEAAACFANSEGGAIIVGVDDKTAGPAAFAGCTIDSSFLRKRIWELANPNLTVEVEAREVLGSRVLVVLVPRGYELHKVRRKLKHRIDCDCVDMTPADQLRVMEERSGYDWSSEETAVPLTMASPAALERARSLLRAAGDESRDDLARQSDAELLRRLGLATPQGNLNRAGAILFVGSEKGGPLVSYKRRRSAGGGSQTRIDSREPLLLGFAEVKSAIDAVNELRHVRLGSGVGAQIRAIPDAAVREAIINGIMHRDYRLADPVDIEFVGDQLVVDSPGGFVSGINPANILSHPSKPRNRTLTSALRSLRLAEQEGVGVDRMYREMIRVGHSPPDIQDHGGRVRCVLIGGTPVEPVLHLMGGLDESIRDDVDVALVIYSLLNRAQIAPADLAPTLQKSETEALAALRRAESADIVCATARTRSYRSPTFRFSDMARSILSSRLAYLTTSADEAERHVIEFLAGNETIANSDVCEIIGVGTVQGSRILKQMRERHLVALGSENSTGRGVFYVRGARFSDLARQHGVELAPEQPEAPVNSNASLFDF